MTGVKCLPLQSLHSYVHQVPVEKWPARTESECNGEKGSDSQTQKAPEVPRDKPTGTGPSPLEGTLLNYADAIEFTSSPHAGGGL